MSDYARDIQGKVQIFCNLKTHNRGKGVQNNGVQNKLNTIIGDMSKDMSK